jgi:glycosyltransferase involved in cell wall biosynthesis
MRVLIDGSVFGNKGQKGIQRYVHQLVLATQEHVAIMHHQKHRLSLPPDLYPLVLDAYNKRLPGKNLPLRAVRSFRRYVASKGFDVYHTPFMGVCPHPNTPSVMVVHDMVCEKLPEFFAADATLGTSIKKRAMDAATLLIAISQSTSNDLLDVYPEFQGRVRVIHHGAEHLPQICNSNKLIRNTLHAIPYALFVGDRVGYKNFRTLLYAISESNWPKELQLVVAGPKPTEDEINECRCRNLEKQVRFLGHVSDNELVSLYQNARCFVFPSMQEGFGFPLIEAQRLGTPVVASDIPVFHEIGGDGFESFNTSDPLSLARAVARVVEPDRGTSLRASGMLNATRFSWHNTAAQTAAVWRESSNY